MNPWLALIDISADCYQEITHNCSVNALTSFSWWVDRFGNNITYWSGDKTISSKGCECGDNGSCDTSHVEDRANICNCDARDNVNVDYGVLTSRDQLPVMELAYGDSEYRYSWIHYTLGRFTCEGKRWIYPSEIHDNDFAVKVGWTNTYASYLSTSYKLTFGETIYDRSLGSWDLHTFTAPVDGFYSFHLHLHYYDYDPYYDSYNSPNYFRVYLYRITDNGTFYGES